MHCIYHILYAVWSLQRNQSSHSDELLVQDYQQLLLLQLQQSNTSMSYNKYYYTVNHKEVEPFYFCNNFVKYQHTWIIFGTRVA